LNVSREKTPESRKSPLKVSRKNLLKNRESPLKRLKEETPEKQGIF